MKKRIALLLSAAVLVVSCSQKNTAQSAQAAPAAEAKTLISEEIQLFKKDSLETWNREKVAGGEGVLAGKFSFTRNDANPDWVIREIGWMTLEPGASIGLHSHTDNDDAYIIVSGTGEFTDSEGKTVAVAGRDITIAHPGQKHGLKNTGSEPLIFLDIVSKNASPDAAWANEPQVFKAAELAAWDRTEVAGGKGVLAGKFSYNRNDQKTFPLYEIGWMTLAPGASIGLHAHTGNEDAYIIVSGAGEFAGTDEKALPAGEGDITIARHNQKHSLSNTGTTDLVFLDIVAK
ncbi:MAG: cupin domain-containing protein [Spirochaetaceae bacterium]|jgi:mannose-6-phosphate isomerase-like protein (cupin superfamily)|nr:cupin domain-containing protein [Spirochaetaceae bacterium]